MGLWLLRYPLDSSRGFPPHHTNTARVGDPGLRAQNDGWLRAVLSHPSLRSGWGTHFRAARERKAGPFAKRSSSVLSLLKALRSGRLEYYAVRHPAICLFRCDFRSAMITEQVRAIHPIKATAAGQPSLYFGQPCMDNIISIHDITSYVLVEKGIVFQNRHTSRNVSFRVTSAAFRGAAYVNLFRQTSSTPPANKVHRTISPSKSYFSPLRFV
jgi:hypothetical protein